MLKISKDESLHSLIYRTHNLYGISNFSNIITFQGMWCVLPRILDGSIEYYNPYDDDLLLSIMRDFKFSGRNKMTFNNQRKYLNKLNIFFASSQNFIGKAKSIKYCLKCIREHIVEHGHGFIHAAWSDSFDCPKHKKNLFYISETSRTSTLTALKEIYRGEHPEEYFLCTKEEVELSFKNNNSICYDSDFDMNYMVVPYLRYIFEIYIKPTIENKNLL